MQGVALVPEGNAAVGCHIVDVNVLVKVYDKLALGVNLQYTPTDSKLVT